MTIALNSAVFSGTLLLEETDIESEREATDCVVICEGSSLVRSPGLK